MALRPVKEQPGLFVDTDTGQVVNLRDFREPDRYDNIVISPAGVGQKAEVLFFHEIPGKRPPVEVEEPRVREGWPDAVAMDVNIRHPQLGKCDFYRNDAIWVEPAPHAVQAMEDTQCRPTRVEGGKMYFAPTKDLGPGAKADAELFEVHLGSAEIREDNVFWGSSEVTFRKVEFDSLPLAQGYLNIENRQLSLSLFGFDAKPAFDATASFSRVVPTTLFFWHLPKPDSVRKRVKAQASGWRKYAVNFYLDKRGEVEAKKAAQQAKALVEEKRAREEAKQEREQAASQRRKETRKEKAREDRESMSAGIRARLHEIETEARPHVVGEDDQGRPVYSLGYRREDGVWVCPPAGFSIQDVMRPTVQIQGYRYDTSGNTRLGRFSQHQRRRNRRAR